MARLESGFLDPEVTAEGQRDPPFEGLGRRLTLFQNHYEVCDLPPGGVNLITGGEGEVQAFRLVLSGGIIGPIGQY